MAIDSWPVTSDMVPFDHERFITAHSNEACFSTATGTEWVTVLHVVPTDLYGASAPDELIYASNERAARELFDAYGVSDELTTDCGMLSVPLYRDDTPARGYTPAAIVALSILSRLEEYPILDESDYSEREFNAGSEDAAEAWTEFGLTDSDWENRFHTYVWQHVHGYYSVRDVPDTAYRAAIARTAPESATGVFAPYTELFNPAYPELVRTPNVWEREAEVWEAVAETINSPTACTHPGNNHSFDIVTVHRGNVTPDTLCGFHAAMPHPTTTPLV